MEENTQAKSRMEMPPYSKQEQEMDILKEICLGRKLRTEVTESMLCQHFQISKSALTAAIKKMAEIRTSHQKIGSQRPLCSGKVRIYDANIQYGSHPTTKVQQRAFLVYR